MPLLQSSTLGKFCREIAGGLSPLPTLLREWELTPDEYQTLTASAGFKHEMTVIAREMAELGADAGYIYRMKSLSEEFVNEIVKIMNSPETSVGTKVDLIKFCADMGRLKEKQPSAAQAALMGGPRGPSVVFNFGEGLPIRSMKLAPELGYATEGALMEMQNDPTTQQIQSAESKVERVVVSRPRGFQFDLPADD